MKWAGSGPGRLLSILLVLLAVAALIFLIYSIASPVDEAEFTEFYILDNNGRVFDYPGELVVGQEAGVVVGIINREQKTAAYDVDIFLRGNRIAGIDSVTLEYGDKYEQKVYLIVDTPGENQKVEFLLHKDGSTEIHEMLYLMIDVKEKIEE
jgi:uncharacterized membrane protein